MRLGNTVGDRINKFDSLETQTVETFNELFPECPIRDTDYELEVSIGGPESNNCRAIFVDSVLTKHKMYSDMLYTLDREEFRLDERDLELEEINGTML
jgi:hypothetical protein